MKYRGPICASWGKNIQVDSQQFGRYRFPGVGQFFDSRTVSSLEIWNKIAKETDIDHGSARSQRKLLDNSLVARQQKVLASTSQNSLEIATKIASFPADPTTFTLLSASQLGSTFKQLI